MVYWPFLPVVPIFFLDLDELGTPILRDPSHKTQEIAKKNNTQ